MEGEMVEVLSVLKLHCFPSKALSYLPFHLFTNVDKGDYLLDRADERKGSGTVNKERGGVEGS